MAFDALDAQLRQLQGDIVAKSNQGLMYGGTTKSEYDFLSRAAMDDTKGPNFYSFMAGISAGNLAQQEAQQQQYDRAQGLRDLNSQLIYRDAQTRNVNAQAAGQEATNPFIPDAQTADIGYRRAMTDQTAANAIGQYNINPYLAAGQQADNSYKAAMASNTVANAANQFLQNPYAAQQAYQDAENKRLQNEYYPQVVEATAGLKDAQAQAAANKKPGGYAGLTALQAQALAAQQKAPAPVPASATGTPPPATTAVQPAPTGKPAPQLAQGIDVVLKNILGKRETTPGYVPTPVEAEALRQYQAYQAAGGAPIPLR